MKITSVRVYPVSEEKLKGFASVVFDSCFMVKDIKIIRGEEGLFVSMPARKRKDGRYDDVAHPLNSGTRRLIEHRILAEYRRLRQEDLEEERLD